MKKILSILLIVITFVLLAQVDTYAYGSDKYDSYDNVFDSKTKYGKKHNIEIFNYYKENLEELKANYELEFEKKLNANYIEYYSTVYVLDAKKYATYLDFNGNNGYMIVTFDYQLITIEDNGDLPYIRNYNILYYSHKTKFMVFNKNNFSFINLDYTDDLVSVNKIDVEPTSGYITNITNHVSSNYSNYTLEYSYSLPNYNHISQRDTSIYVTETINSQGYTVYGSEGNCVLNATYSMMNNWQQVGVYPSLPSYKEVVDYEPSLEEAMHSQFLEAGYIVNSCCLLSDTAFDGNGILAIDNVPKLYAKIRHIVYEKYPDKYGLGGIDEGYVPNIVNYVLADYGYSNCTVNNYGDDFAVMEAYFNLYDRAQFITVYNDSTFSAHAMAAIGFAKYSYETGWWIFKTTKYAYFIEVDDGHSISAYNNGQITYYDPYSTSNSKEVLLIKID